MMRSPRHAFKDKTVAKVFAEYPIAVRTRLLALREMIYSTAVTIDGVGRLEETLKWGQPSYLTTETGSGSTIRIDRVKDNDERVAMYFHCQADLIATFRELYPADMQYAGNRSIVLGLTAKLPERALRHCIGLALTYHARKQPVARKKRQPGKAGTSRRARLKKQT